MFKNYLMTALRNILRKKLFSAINITGFTIALACSLLIYLWVGKELGYDKFNENYNRIYKLEENENTMLAPGVGKMLEGKIPEIQQVVRFKYWKRDCLLQNNKSEYLVENLAYADENLFDIFTFKFLQGDSHSALEAPNSIVLTESIAKILYRDSPAIGKFVRFNNQVDYKITGVIEDVKNSHLPVRAFASFKTLESQDSYYVNNFYGTEFPTYMLLNGNAAPRGVEEKINNIFEKHQRWRETKPAFHLIPLKNVYFSDKYSYEEWTFHGNKTVVYIFLIIALAVLLIAVFNYLNLTTAISSMRHKEIAVRKIVGASKTELFFQFIGESVLTCLLSSIIALLLIMVILPLVNNLLEENLSASILFSFPVLTCLLSSIIVIGMLGGIYPAMILSSMQPVTAIKNNKGKGSKAVLFRHSLVIIQFVASIILIVSSIIIHEQTGFIKNTNLGFDQSNILNIQLNSDLLSKKELFKEELLRIPQIKSVSFSHELLGVGWGRSDVKYDDNKTNMASTTVDPDFIKTFGIKLISGRNFNWEINTDQIADGNTNGKFIINQKALSVLDYKQPLGKEIALTDWGKGTIIGVIKDFNFKTLHSKIEPLILYWEGNGHKLASIKVSATDLSKTIDNIKKVYQSLSPSYPFTYKYLDDFTGSLYKNEMKFRKLIKLFTTMSIFVCCLGMFGLVSFIISRKTKEIGIRKVIGATTSDIITLLTADFIRFVLVANVIAWPIAYYFMNKWLQGFAYRIDISWWIFVLAGGIALLIALATVSYQAIKAATANPVKSLKYE